jgi:predicted adenine nucleotide alpha hydrolase (AANH) superfamily ATPase
LLRDEYEVISFFYNPNISPPREYEKRFHELQQFALKSGFPLVEGPRDSRNWTERVRNFRFEGERSVRCRECYRIRLEETFKEAVKRQIEIVTTVLSVSPHKDAVMINAIGRELSALYNISFLEADFKKKNGFKKSVEISKENGFYRQAYCGCVYSQHQRYNKTHQ